ncbi:hypothetical protein ACFL4T_06130, partial [candidate division KSB1 bacterium]
INMNKLLQLLILFFLFISFCAKEDTSRLLPAEKKREFATALYNRHLYKQAVDEYKDLLDNYNLETKLQANINYLIADIFFERLNDYESAMAYYMKVKHLFPESRLVNDANKKIISCLERLDRAVDAQQALKETTHINAEDEKDFPGEVLAEIGDRKITSGFLDFLIKRNLSSLPQNMRPEKIDKDQKLAFLREYIIVELLYNSAKRLGYDRDKDIIDGAFQARKFMMANKVRQKEIEEKVKITEKDLTEYYNNNKDAFAEKDKDGKVIKQKTFAEVRDQVYQRVAEEKQRSVIDGLLSRLMDAQNVNIFTDKVK